MKYFAEISYRGTQYNGWQIQQNTEQTVQGFINKALQLVLREDIETLAGGRTDAGVHCLSQFIEFESKEITDKEYFLYKINCILPEDIYLKDIFLVKPEAHARFDALSRSYAYHIGLEKNPFAEGLQLRYWHHLDIDLMNEAAKLLLIYQDFECFSKVKTDVKTFNCTIYRAEWKKEDKTLIFYIQANRFLRGMVRAIVGTLLDVGRKKITKQDFENIILSKKRTQAGRNVPPEGLFLTEIAYPKDIFLEKS
jgi:tRNA pseudouridine38-40 synthase